MPPDALSIESAVLSPLASKTSVGFRVAAGLLGGVFFCGLCAWVWQLVKGLRVTGLGVPEFWGIYIINFVFFIGISHAGTLISAILRITHAQWRRPFTRIAEMITITSLPFAASCVIVDLGRPDRFLNVILYPHLTSPILWDVLCISTYMVISCLYFYFALIPDLAFCRDRLAQRGRGMAFFYRWAAFGWQGTEQEKKTHRRLMTILSVLLLALVISVHTNVGFIFGMTNKPGWHTAAIGPYFVIGAAFQGLGALAAISIAVRYFFHLEGWITEQHLNALRQFFLTLTCFWMYYTIVEYLTIFYGRHVSEMNIFWAKLAGPFQLSFWGMIILCFFIPFTLLVTRRVSLVPKLFLAGLSANVGMWLERYSVIVPPGAAPFLPWGAPPYSPSWIEWTITAGWLAGFGLLFLIFTRIFPLLTVWELQAPVCHVCGTVFEEPVSEGRINAP